MSETYEFLEHLALYVLSITVGLIVMHAITLAVIKQLKVKYLKTARASQKLVNETMCTLKMAMSLRTDAQAFYDELMGGKG